MRHSLNGGRPESRISAISNSRRSARQLTHQHTQPLIDPNEHFSPVNQPHWVLKPLFFEVPQRDPNPIFVGRQWLYGEITEHLASNLPTNKGVVLTGNPGTGKTALMLKLVELSCFGRGEPIYQGMLAYSAIIYFKKGFKIYIFQRLKFIKYLLNQPSMLNDFLNEPSSLHCGDP